MRQTPRKLFVHKKVFSSGFSSTRFSSTTSCRRNWLTESLSGRLIESSPDSPDRWKERSDIWWFYQIFLFNHSNLRPCCPVVHIFTWMKPTRQDLSKFPPIMLQHPSSQTLGSCSSSLPASGQLVEELFIELLVDFLAPHRQEDVAADELVHHLKLVTSYHQCRHDGASFFDQFLKQELE